MINLALAKEHALAGQRKAQNLMLDTENALHSPTFQALTEIVDHFAGILAAVTGPTPESEAMRNTTEEDNGNSHRLS